ncbi:MULTISPECIES: TrmH family RNA methyltransferase [Methylobacterium]|uniref:23S rRNA (Guanosine-2'-O-)-methyltransferase RlmB n=1 Tax=Methylobacterium thuringiense TaxID=1003091 RepID=A0ABQ4TN31_9HYPH|nr:MULTISPECIES: RNA methyltransferase [Methylobacterium]TXN19941.1 RNA methyltransferase [Methylobacterium sp. WL9]GJE56022.1 23S rRNA (guanosine-2'-O-)-methyltransferase RlmB [Methylobacterium thuringiense]
MSASPAITIDDPADPRLAPYASIRERDLVGRRGRFIVEGEVTLRLMLSPASRFRVESILLSPERLPGLGDLIETMPAPPPVYCASRAVMGAVAGFPMHRGVLAVGLSGAPPEPAGLIPPAPAPATVLGLVGLTNHDNVGGLFRNAAAFGADAVLLDDATCDPLYRKAIRVSAGAALTVPFARTASPQALLDLAARHDLVSLAMTPGTEADIADIALPARALVLLGSEGPGLPPDLMAHCQRIRIGMAAGFDSLNVATAGAIALHHLLRRRCRL